ncbi:MAG: hypothetical protein M1820_009610 [Bogoriella megaspora]|nr:MAG: hypothetical protein M1820_009610 [Bogoriella megaspora]
MRHSDAYVWYRFDEDPEAHDDPLGRLSICLPGQDLDKLHCTSNAGSPAGIGSFHDFICSCSSMSEVTCFQKVNGSVTSNSTFVPCEPINITSPVSLCCVLGNQCSQSNLCWEPKKSGRWYVGGCTDEYWGSNCPTQCADTVSANVAFNFTDWIWHCCGADCDAPTEETFTGPPDILPPGLENFTSESLTLIASTASTASVIRVNVTSTDTLSTSQPSSVTSTTTQAAGTVTSNATSDGLSKSHKVAIGVGVGIGTLVTIGAVVGLFLYLRRISRSLTKMIPAASSSSKGDISQAVIAEMDDQQKRSELTAVETQRLEIAGRALHTAAEVAS